MRRRRSGIVVHDLKQGHVVRSARIAAGNNVRKSNRHRRVSNLTRRNLRPQHEGEEHNLLHLPSKYPRLPGSIVKSCAGAASREAGSVHTLKREFHADSLWPQTLRAKIQPVDGELLFYAHFLRFCNLDTMNRARSGCPCSPLVTHQEPGPILVTCESPRKFGEDAVTLNGSSSIPSFSGREGEKALSHLQYKEGQKEPDFVLEMNLRQW